jgi:hypothetical protein
MPSEIPEDGIQIAGGWVEMIHSPTYRWICAGCSTLGPIRPVPQESVDGLDFHRLNLCPARTKEPAHG